MAIIYMNTMLALDQSSHATGWAIFRDEQLIEYGVINLEEGDVGTRLVELKNKIMNLITKYNVNFVAFEDIQLQNNNVVTFKVLAEVFGLIHYLVNSINIKYVIVPSATWKSTLHIKGKKRSEQKKDAQRYVLEQYNVKAIQDTVDAICIGTHVINSYSYLWEDEDNG